MCILYKSKIIFSLCKGIEINLFCLQCDFNKHEYRVGHKWRLCEVGSCSLICCILQGRSRKVTHRREGGWNRQGEWIKMSLTRLFWMDWRGKVIETMQLHTWLSAAEILLLSVHSVWMINLSWFIHGVFFSLGIGDHSCGYLHLHQLHPKLHRLTDFRAACLLCGTFGQQQLKPS